MRGICYGKPPPAPLEFFFRRERHLPWHDMGGRGPHVAGHPPGSVHPLPSLSRRGVPREWLVR